MISEKFTKESKNIFRFLIELEMEINSSGSTVKNLATKLSHKGRREAGKMKGGDRK